MRELPEGVSGLLPGYLPQQRWYGGSVTEKVAVVDSELLTPDDRRDCRLWWAIVDAGGAKWQLLLGERLGGDPAEFLHGHEEAVLGMVSGSYFYDATLDPSLGLILLDLVCGGTEQAERVRPAGAEQSNTSLVYDDRVIVKLFRRLVDGPQPDVEATTGLVEVGFAHVPKMLGVWRRAGHDLAVAQEFLVGAVEGWALALTSLRDLYASTTDDPAEAGGDFQSDATRLGHMAAEMHLALATAFGVSRDAGLAGLWADSVAGNLHHLRGEEQDLWSHARTVVEDLRGVTDAGAAIRVHGDFHLGQVLCTDAGWYVLDFEGEPARTLEDRMRPNSPLKDVAGMLRSLHYAARVALRDHGLHTDDLLEQRAVAWEGRNRLAFLDGYLGYPRIDELLPRDQASLSTLMTAFELDKAIYELDYERSYRPDWVSIPREAIRGLLGAA